MDIVLVVIIGGGALFAWKNGWFDQFLQPAAAPTPAVTETPTTPAAVEPAVDTTSGGGGCHGTCQSVGGQICCVSTTGGNEDNVAFEALSIDQDAYDHYFTGASSKSSNKKNKKKTASCANDQPTAKVLACQSEGKVDTFGWTLGNLPPTVAVPDSLSKYLKNQNDPDDPEFGTYGNAPEIAAFRDLKASGKKSDKTNSRGNYSIDHYVKKQQHFNATGFGTLGGLGSIYGEDGSFYDVNPAV